MNPKPKKIISRAAAMLLTVIMAFAGAQTARAQKPCNVTFDISGKGTVKFGGVPVTNNDPPIPCLIPINGVLTLTPETGYYVSSVTYDAPDGLSIDLHQSDDFQWSLNIHPYEGSDTPTITVHIVFDKALAGGADEASAVALTADDDLSRLTGGWYKVESDLTLGHTVNLLGDTHITIATGKTLTVSTSVEYGISGSALTVSGEGTLAVSASKRAIYVDNYTQMGCAVTLSGDTYGLHATNDVSISGGSLTTSGASYGIKTDNGAITISGGTVSSSGELYGLFAARAMNITGGTVSASGNNYGIRGYSVSITGGQVTASSGGIWSYGDITLGWTSATDYITASGFTVKEGKHVKIADGQKLYGGGFPSASYNGTIGDPSALNGLMLRPTAAVTESGTNEYTIRYADGWDAFCDALQDNDTYNRFSGKTVKLGADITVSRMAGSDNHEFTGTFDGQGYTLTFTSTENVNGVAPFSYVSETTPTGGTKVSHPAIRNLNVVADINTTAQYASALVGRMWCTLTIEGCTVGGTIQTSNKYAAGFIAEQNGNASITDCRSSVTIQSSVEGDGTHGGFVAECKGVLNITGCVFDGKLLSTGTNATTNCGGFVGYGNGTITNSLYAPADLGTGETEVQTGDVNNHPSATFARDNATVTNSYYTRALGTAQGKATRTVTAAADVTIDAIALTGTATQYTVSGITAYSGGGLQRGETLYYGSGDQLSLTLSNSATGAPQGYQYTYTASAGTLSGTTLTMPDQDVTITAALAPIDWATVNQGTSKEDPYMIYNKDQLLLLAHRVNGTNGETAVENGYQYKYFKLGADITFTHPDNEGDDYDENYEAIGTYIGGTMRYFKGKFDGANHTVSGIRIRKTGSSTADIYQGLFGCIDSDADIYDVHLTDARITGFQNVGGIVGYNFVGNIMRCSVTDSYITATDNRYYGTICGSTTNTLRLRNNYYHGCTVNGTAVTSGKGCDGSDITAKNGALPAYAITLGENITTPPGTFVGHNEWLTTPPVNPRLAPGNGFTLAGNHYFASGYEFTPGSTLASGAAQGYTPRATLGGQLLDLYTPTGDDDLLAGTAIARLTITADCDGKTLASTEAIYSTRQPVTVAYIDAEGQPASHNAIALDGTEGVLGEYGEETWYFVGADISYSGTINCNGNVNIILADGYTMTVSSNSAGICGSSDGGTLTIYGQTLGTGTLDITATNYGIDYGIVVIRGGTVNATGSYQNGIAAYGDVTITGGTVNATGDINGIYAGGAVTITGGQVTVTSNSDGIFADGDVTITGGQVTASSNSNGICAGGDITLGWTNATDFIKATSYCPGPNGGVIIIADGQTLFDEDGNYYSGNDVTIPDGKTLRPLPNVLALDDAADNSAAITANDRETRNVILYGRTLYKDGDWNTLCLPFDISTASGTLSGDNVQAMTLNTTTSNFADGTLTLNFDAATGQTIPAGTPFIIKWDNTGVNIENPVFTDVYIPIEYATADAITTALDEASSKTDYVDFIGTYSPIVWESENNSVLFLGSGNTLYFPQPSGSEIPHVNAFRGYFQLKGLTASEVSRARMNFDEQGTQTIIGHTEITEITEKVDAAWYSLDGVKLDSKPSSKGIYIHGNKKVVVE